MKSNRWKGARSMQRLFRNLPDAMHRELEDVLDQGGTEVQRAIIARTPRQHGTLAAGIQKRLLRKTLRLRVGLIGTKRERKKLFYGRILDLGRKAQTVTARRRRNAPYTMRVRAIAPKRFVTGRYADVRNSIGRRLRNVWDRVLSRVGRGDD